MVDTAFHASNTTKPILSEILFYLRLHQKYIKALNNKLSSPPKRRLFRNLILKTDNNFFCEVTSFLFTKTINLIIKVPLFVALP